MFARKLMRPFASAARREVLNEARAIDILCRADKPSENIVSVLRHGWLSASGYYFIDMELCEATLEDFLNCRDNADIYIKEQNPRFYGIALQHRGLWSTWDILEQVSSGVAYVHSCKQVHRDLKPRNGKNFLHYKFASR